MMMLRQDDGFTLLEVTVAMLILALSLSALLPILGSAPARLVEAKRAAYAFQLASSQLEHYTLREDWEAFPVSGELDEWEWELTAQVVDEAQIIDAASYPLNLNARVWRADSPERTVALLDRIVWVKTQ